MSKKNIVQFGVMVDYVDNLNFGQTVDIIDTALYPEPGYMIRPHGEKRIIYVPLNSVMKGEKQFDYSDGPYEVNPRICIRK